MIVIADTTPLNHLILIEQIHLLHALYGRVIVPQAVLSELQAQATPPKVKAWIDKRPDWLEVNRTLFVTDPGLARLDPGERDAIVLAQELGADLLLMDDLGGRQEAIRRNLKVAGTLTVLYLGARRGLVQDFPATIEHLRRTGFRASSEIIQLFLDRYAKAMNQPPPA
jgi:predicted nucleic acid-binding protein